MSREQWGHGYYKGLKDGIEGKRLPKYLCVIHNNHVSHFYIIRERHDNVLVCELFDEPLDMIYLAGMLCPFDESIIDFSNYQEIDTSQIECKEFYSQDAALSYMAKDARSYLEEKMESAETAEEAAHYYHVIYG